MQIKNIEGLSGDQIRSMVANGGKFVIYKYCISIVVMSFNNPTDIYFIKPGESRISPAIGFLITNFFLGWWGIPWGPIHTIGNIYTILNGGKDVTNEVLAEINQNDSSYGTGNSYNVGGNASSQATPSNPYNVPNPNNSSNNTSSSPYNVPNSNGNSGGNSNSGTSAYNIPR